MPWGFRVSILVLQAIVYRIHNFRIKPEISSMITMCKEDVIDQLIRHRSANTDLIVNTE